MMFVEPWCSVRFRQRKRVGWCLGFEVKVIYQDIVLESADWAMALCYTEGLRRQKRGKIWETVAINLSGTMTKYPTWWNTPQWHKLL